MSRNKPSSERQRVHGTLLSQPTTPQTAMTIAAATGIDGNKVRRIVHNLMIAGLAHNSGTGSPRAAAYLPGAAPRADGPPAAARIHTPGQKPAPRTAPSDDKYTGAELRAFAHRPGAMDAYALPSLHNGQRIQRRAPMLMGAQPTQKAARP